MAKNIYPEDLRLDQSSDFLETVMKLTKHYGMQDFNTKDLIIEILMHHYGINGSDKLAENELLEGVFKDYVPDTYKVSIKYKVDELKKEIRMAEKHTRHSCIIALVECMKKSEKSLNRVAQKLEDKGMSKGVKKRFGEAKKDPESVRRAKVLLELADSLSSKSDRENWLWDFYMTSK